MVFPRKSTTRISAKVTSAKERMMTGNQVPDNQGFAEFLFAEHTQIMTIFLENHIKISVATQLTTNHPSLENPRR